MATGWREYRTWTASTVFRPALARQAPCASWRGCITTRRRCMSELQRRHGDLVHFRIGPQHVYVVLRADLIRAVLVTHQKSFKKGPGFEAARIVLGDGLLTSEGDFHLRQRRMLQPAFHRRRVAGYGGIMVEEAARVGAAWDDGDERDVAADMSGLALRVVSRALFGAELDEDALAISRDVAEVGEFFDYLTIALLPVLMRTPLPRVRRFRAGIDHLQRETARGHRRAPGRSGRRERRPALDPARRPRRGGRRHRHERRADPRRGRDADHGRPRDDGERAHLDVVPAGPASRTSRSGFARRARRRSLAVAPRPPTMPRRCATPRRVLLESMRLYPPAWGIERRAVARPGDRRLRHPRRRGRADADVRHQPRPAARTPTRCGSIRSGSWARPRPRAPTGPTRCSAAGRASASASASRCSRRCSCWPSWGSAFRLQLDPGRPVVPQARVSLRPRDGLWMRPQRRVA